MDNLFSKLVAAVSGDKAAAAPAKDYWVDDSKCKACYECEAPFTMLVRRHHCRICGRIFCANCTVTSAPAAVASSSSSKGGGGGDGSPGQQSWQRICNYCQRMRQRDDDSSSASEQQQPGVAVRPSAVQRLLGNVHVTGPDSSRSQQDGAAAAGGSNEHTGSSRPHVQHQQQQLHSSSSGSRHGVADGSLTWEVPPGLDRNWGPAAADLCLHSPRLTAADGGAAADSAAEAEAGHHSREGAGGAGSSGGAHSIGALPQQGGGVNSSGLHPLVLLNRLEFGSAAEQHLLLMLRQLLTAEDVQQAEVWLPILLQLVKEAAGNVQPAAAAAFGENDPRFYIKVKRLPDVGAPSDSCVIKGVVAKKNVAHRRMRAEIDSPAVLLLSGALEYQRVANKLSSFDTLLDQEREHLRLAVARIAACKPDVLLVERSVARAAQEELLNRGISLVHHTKPELLERLARCMGVKVAASVEELSSVFVGSCSKFRVELMPQSAGPDSTTSNNAAASSTDAAADAAAAPAPADAAAVAVPPPPALPRPGHARPTPVSSTPAPPKTLMYFDGCGLPLGCTVLLQGASAAELTKVKRIVKFGVLAAYHLGLEVNFLAEELALATAALASPGMAVSDVEICRSLARAAISSSLDCVNPCGLPAEDRLLLSMSPHILVPGAWEQEERNAAHRHQQQHRQQQQQQRDRSPSPTPLEAVLASKLSLEGGGGGSPPQQQQQHAAGTAQLRAAVAGVTEQQHVAAGAASAVPRASTLAPADPAEAIAAAAAAAAAAADCDPLGAGSAAAVDAVDAAAAAAAAVGAGGRCQAEPEFTDPLRRRTLGGDEGLLGDGVVGLPEAAMAQQEAQEAAALAALADLPRATLGLQLYDRQHVYLSMACRNPRRGLMCEPPSVKRIDLYCHSDLSLAGFIVAAAPHAHKKCQVAGCGDGVTCHVRTFLHGSCRITMSIATLPSHDALPGEERGQVWTWLRPKGAGEDSNRAVRRLPLSQSSACMSLGMFLSLCFSAPGLEVFGRQLHSGFVRYFGLGRTVMCLHQDAIYPSAVELPQMRVAYSLNAQLMWLKQEAAELCQESNEVFDVLESALQSHPYFKSQAAAAAAAQAAATAAATAAAAAAASVPSPRAAQDAADSQLQPDGTPATSPAAAAAAAAVGDGVSSGADAAAGPVAAASPRSVMEPPAGGAAVVTTAIMLSAVRKDRTTFMDQVADTVQRATPHSPTASGGGGGPPSPLWDEQLMVGIQELNRLRRSLAFTILTWAAILQDPAYFTHKLAALSATGPAAIAAAAAATAAAMPGSPLAAAAAAAAAVMAGGGAGGELTAESSLVDDGGSAHGGSMFHMPAALAAQRMGISDGQEGGDASSSVSVPLLPNLGPIAVKAVANLVAAEAVNSASSGGGGLLAGSHGVMMAVTQHKAPPGQHSSPAGTPGTCGTPVSAGAGGVGDHEAAASGSTSPRGGAYSSPSRGIASSSLGPSGGSRKLSSTLSAASSPRVSAAAALAAAMHRRTTSSGGSSMAAAAAAAAAAAGAATSTAGSDDATEDGDAAHDRFVAWMTSHEIQGSMDSDNMSDFFPEQLPDWGDEAAADAASASASAAGDSRGAQTPTPPATPDMSTGAGALSQAAAAAAGGAQHVPMSALERLQATDMPATAAGRGTVTFASSSMAAGQQQLQHSLPPIRTASGNGLGGAAPAPAAKAVPAGPSAAAAAAAAAAAPAGGFTAVPRVVLPGRAMMPAGINDTVVPIFDAEPTSIAAYFLSSRAYQQQLNAAMRLILHEESKKVAEEARRAQDEAKRAAAAATAAALRQQAQQGSSAGPAGGAEGGNGGGSTAVGGGSSSSASASAGLQPPVPTQHSRTRSQEAGAAVLAAAVASAASDAADNGSVGAGAEHAAAAAGGDAGSSVTAAAGSTNSISAQRDGSPRHQRTPSLVGSSSGSSAAWRVKLRQQQAAASRGHKQVQPDWLALLLSPEPLHVKHAFEDESPGMPWLRARFAVTAYFAPQFAELRRRCIVGGEAAFITSLCRCRKWASRGGKSNAYFAKTRDDRFIIKSLSKPEKASFLEFAPAYFEHMAHAAATGTPTTLAKIAGVYSIGFKQAAASTGQGAGGAAGLFKDGCIDVLVMENIFYDRQISRIYDLKGSERSRFNADAAANPQDSRAVHLDDNLRRANLQAPILVEQGLLRVMECALWADTSFLSGLGVMDYSLLLGVDKEHNQLVVAIIDFIRTYTWDKQLETWVKSSGILGGAGKEPTIVSPKQYMRRFRAAISSYLTVVPDGRDMEPPLDPDAA